MERSKTLKTLVLILVCIISIVGCARQQPEPQLDRPDRPTRPDKVQPVSQDQPGPSVPEEQQAPAEWQEGNPIMDPATQTSVQQEPIQRISPFAAYGGDLAQIGDELVEMGSVMKRAAAQEGLSWDIMEPNLDKRYIWDGFDGNLKTAQQLGIDLLITIKSANQKDQAACHSGCTPRTRCTYNPCDWEAYGAFLSAAIKRYKGSIKHWQIENEPAKGNYYTGTPEEYADLLERSYTVIKKECPECKVVIAGMMYCNYMHDYHYYFPGVLEALEGRCQGTGCFDIFDVHIGQDCTGTQSDFSSLPAATSEGYANVADLIAGYPKPIWVSEFGPLTCKKCKGIEDALIKGYVVAIGSGFERLFWRTSEAPSHIVDEQGQRTASFYAYRTLVSKLEGFDAVTKISGSQYRFTFQDRGPVYVLWCDMGSCQLPGDIKGEVTLTDSLGKETKTDTALIALGPSPVFIQQ